MKKVTLSYSQSTFSDGWGWIGMDSSMHVMPAHGLDEWMYVDVDGVVPEGANSSNWYDASWCKWNRFCLRR